ncbi:MAG: hypothetical protein K0Q52_3017, partial [Microbacterium sp.]|nr:hypothetical protein [Microbacterium sp.]
MEERPAPSYDRKYGVLEISTVVLLSLTAVVTAW